MRSWIFFVIPIWILGAPQGANGVENVKVKQELSLPSEAGGWKWDGKEKIYNPRTIFDYIDGAGELYRSFNFQSLIVRRFVRLGQPSIFAELYDMGSSEDAYGVFSFERQDEDAGVGQGSEYGGGLLRFWKGKYFVSVYPEEELAEAKSTVLHLGQAIASSIKSSGPAPQLLTYLPGAQVGLREKSIRYFHNHVCLNQRFFVANENIFHLGKKTEGVIAQYLRGQSKSHLLMIRYPTAKQAEVAFESFRKNYMPEAKGKGVLRTEDRKWTAAKMQRKLVIVVFAAPSEADAGELMKAAEEKLGEK